MHVFENFKSFASAELELFRPVTLLIGPNGSGKSNLIEGVELLAHVAHGTPLHEITDVGRARGPGLEIRGGLGECPRHGTDTFTMGFSAAAPFANRTRPIEYRVSITVRPSPHVSAESLRVGWQTYLFETLGRPPKAGQGMAVVRYNNFGRGGNKPQTHIRADRSVLAQYEEFAENNRKQKECVRLVRLLRIYLRASFVFEPNPKLMRGYERITGQPLARNGANLSAVLYGLKKGGKGDQETLERLLGRIRQVPEEPFSDLSFVDTDLNDVIFGFRHTEQSPLRDARILSDGTLRCLAVLTALETAEERSRIVIEEFDNGVHPSRVKVLSAAMEDCAERKALNVLATTHNPATLDGLSLEQLQNVVMCVWDAGQAASRLVRLTELPRFMEFMNRGRLGDLVTRKVLDRYLAPDSEEKRRAQAGQWVESLP